MNARNVHAVLAAGVQRPNLLTEWQRNAGFLRSKGIAPETIDLAALRKFSGLTVKVRHNGLRLNLPLAFRLMSLAEMDIDVFSEYATYRSANGCGYATSSEAKAADLISFLGRWLPSGERKHVLLWDLIRHEQALIQLRNPVPQEGTFAPENYEILRARFPVASVPVIKGKIVLCQMQCDPRAVEKSLFERPFCVERIPKECHNFCYWRKFGVDEVHIIDLDEFGYYALTLIDGATSVGDLYRQMVGGSRPTQLFLRALRQLASAGIIGFSHSPILRMP